MTVEFRESKKLIAAEGQPFTLEAGQILTLPCTSQPMSAMEAPSSRSAFPGQSAFSVSALAKEL